MEAYINGMSAVTPQNTFSGEILPDEPVGYSGIRSLKCIEPAYSEYIDPMLARRMSRIIKTGVCAALKSLREAGIKNPDAIITGTGYGCIEDTGRFLRTIYENEEKLLNPTPFIQSTHNTVGASIALMLKCSNYNNTYGHRSLSFESALLDAMILINEKEAENVLVGGLDELTSDLFTITDRLGLWKKENIDSLNLRHYKTRGTLPGEGSTFLVLARDRSERSFARIGSVNTLFKPFGYSEVENWLRNIIKTNLPRPDLVIYGINGDSSSDTVYEHMGNSILAGIPSAYYKHLCGEYYTSVAFAVALAAAMIREQRIPEIMKTDNLPAGEVKNILIYNQDRNINHSAIMVSSC